MTSSDNLTPSVKDDGLLEEEIEKNAQGPAVVSNDTGRVEQHLLRDQIEADRYLASKRASRGKGLGIRMTRINGGTAH